MKEMTWQEFFDKNNLLDIILVDIREHYLYIRGTIKSAINIPYSTLKRIPDKYLSKTKVYGIFCENGIMSKKLASSLVSKGYQIINLKEGYDNYREKNI